MSNRYRKEINGRKYCVFIHEGWFHATVRIKTGIRSYNRTILTHRKMFCEDIDRFAAQTLNKAVQKREEDIEDSERYDAQVERALDVVEEQYDS